MLNTGRETSTKPQAVNASGSMLYWLAPWTLNPKTRIQIWVEPLFHCHKNSSAVSSLFDFPKKGRTLVEKRQTKHKHKIQ